MNIVKVDLIIDLCILLMNYVFLSSVFTLTLIFLWDIWMCRKLKKKGGRDEKFIEVSDTAMRPEMDNPIAQAVSCQQGGFNPWLLYVGSVVDIVALGWVFSNTSVSPANSHSIKCFISPINHVELVQ
jgi:hypothetical protein